MTATNKCYNFVGFSCMPPYLNGACMRLGIAMFFNGLSWCWTVLFQILCLLMCKRSKATISNDHFNFF